MGVTQVLLLAVICSNLHHHTMAKTSTSHNLFAADLLPVMTKGKSSENVVYSPASIQTSLALVFAGADGKTAEEMRKVLHFGEDDRVKIYQNYEQFMRLTFKNGKEDEPVLKMANRLYINKNIKVAEEFQKISQESFYAQAKNLNFGNSQEAVNEINQWVEEQTENKIQNLLQPDSVDGATNAVLVNAIYFKSDWEKPFSETSTSKMPFQLKANQQMEVEMMYQEDDFMYIELPQYNAKALEMKYLNSNISMLLILPNEVDGLAALEAQLKGVDLNKITADMTEEDVAVMLPKFRIEFDVDLKEPLQELGISSMFSNDADLSRMFDSPTPQKISDAKHKAFLDINEAGSEAAAATYHKLIFASLNTQQKDFRADHPFFFAIRDGNNVFFAGHVAKF